MNEQYFISIVLDKRNQKKNGTYPVKLRVFTPTPRKQKLYSTVFEFTEKDFKSIWATVKPRKEFKPYRQKLQALETKAIEVAEKLSTFNFEDFERLMFNKSNNKELNVNYYFQKIIDDKYKRAKISTALGYKNAFACVLRFHNKPVLNFKDVTVSFLEQFESFCTETENKTTATTSIYLRNLRTVFNEAIRDKTISEDIYPFGKGKYQIKSGGKVKKALNKEQLKTLFEGNPETPEQAKAKAFWFFSYLCNGMNFHDILNLKCKDFKGDKITFIRAKTEKNSKELEPITVFLPDYAKQVLNDYGNPAGNPNDFIFDVLNTKQTPSEQRSKKQNFIRFTNQHFLKYAKSLGIDEPISTYWARHSFSTMLLRANEPIAVISEALGHTDIKTTMGYLAGFEDEVKKELPAKLLDF